MYEPISDSPGSSVVPGVNTSASDGNPPCPGANPPSTTQDAPVAVRRSSRESKFPQKYKDFEVKIK
jgi:hypothetical protein